MMTLLVAVGSYALGCFSTAYYLFRFSTGADIRTQGAAMPALKISADNWGLPPSSSLFFAISAKE